ncbi:D-alanyl-D-alanine carboxypeptidase/D-alanyl-D-alanine endopeptidase [Nannocystis pusilla]|uniref:D-alanyl-D-alanine carboxypeptidase/D-alanyl-D-alanine-endopeptidase n=1 Tax=Nannocystis pusilla TaxID=889268 RepID=A0ABS7U1X0_9BACT|nr:D-alanyl-D-alanine carboxypeptidase/D-alanyl-D-alanine-endopeptidase [Nannocystis pusilla]
MRPSIGPRLAIAAALGVCCLAPPTSAAGPAADPAPAAAPADLASQIDLLLQAKFLARARVGLLVVDMATGARLYEKNPDLGLNPASNIKLVTTAAALSLLGPEHRYVTRVYAKKGALKGHTVDGDLFLKGGGDPSLVTADLYQLASDLRALGVTKVTGGLVLDSTAYDRDELPPLFDQKDELASFRAPGGATAVNFGTYVVLARPGPGEGDPAIVAIDPPVPSLKLKANTATTASGARNQLKLAIGTNKDGVVEIAVDGTIGKDAAPAEYRYPVAKPAEYAGEVFRLVLKQRGVSLGRSAVKFEAVPEDSERLALVRSEPLSVLVRSVNKLSNNYVAEHILKSLDDHAPATFAGGLARVRTWLEGLGVGVDGFVYKNGSGLYDANRISAAQLVQLLIAVHRDFRFGADFLASLPIAGVDGTLRSRMQEGRAARFVRAKTGSLDGVSTLSGYAGAVGRPPLAFAILFNDLDVFAAPQARDLQNQIAELLAGAVAARP